MMDRQFVRLAVIGAGLVTTGLLAGCTTTGHHQGPATAVITAVSASPGTTAPAAAPTGKPGYDAARSQWKKGAVVASAVQGKFWLAAAADLTHGKATDAGNTAGYTIAAKALVGLTALPDAQQTPVQNAEYHADILALNVFFKTPGLYS